MGGTGSPSAFGDAYAQIRGSDCSPADNVLTLEWEILDGPARGARLQSSEQLSTDTGQRNLKRICEAAGVGPISNTEALHFKPMTINVGPDGEMRGYKSAARRPTPRAAASATAGVEELPEHLTHVPGLVGTLTDWITDTAVSPLRGSALGAALGLVGTAAGRKFGGPTASGTHLYILTLAPTGAGKDHPLSISGAILDAAGMGSLNGPSAFRSDSAVVNMLIRKPLSFCAMDEFGALLRRINGRNAGGHEQAITGILRSAWGASFSSFTSPAYADRDGQRVIAPAMSIFGASTPEEFYAAVEGGDIFNGFLNRFLIISTSINPPPRKPPLDKFDVPESIIAGLSSIYGAGGPILSASLRPGQACKPQIIVPWADAQAERVYDRLREEIRDRVGDASLLVRTAEMALRMATIRAIGVSAREPRITVDDMEWGRDLASWSAERMIRDAAGYVAESDNQRALNRALRVIQKAGRISGSDFCRQTQWVRDGRQREDVLRDLEQSRQIIIEETTGSRPGRPARWISIVH